jgi:hypothetical protein
MASEEEKVRNHHDWIVIGRQRTDFFPPWDKKHLFSESNGKNQTKK